MKKVISYLPMIHSTGLRNNGNWGDTISRDIGKWLSGKEEIKRFHYSEQIDEEDVYVATGSILQWIKSPNVHVWGIGFIENKAGLKIMPKKVHAVRGPLTRDRLLELGVECPVIFGDPALLVPRFYNPDIKKRYKLGIIPHYVDYHNFLLNKFKDDSDVLIINIKKSNLGNSNMNFIDKVLQCEMIVSSSLHGLVVSDAYGIPSLWVKYSDLVFGKGFKFRDYFASVKRTDTQPLIMTKDIGKDDIINSFKDYTIDIDLDALLNSCPFYWKK